jgi:hypothetical protein
MSVAKTGMDSESEALSLQGVNAKTVDSGSGRVRPVERGIAAAGDGWALDLPNDTGAAVEYLRGLERARAIELEAIRTLRHRIGGESRLRGLLRRHRPLLVLLAALLVVTAVGATATSRFSRSDGTSMSGSGDVAHAGHTSMGSGVAVELSETTITTTRATAVPGRTTFVLRNTGERASKFYVVSKDAVTGDPGRLTAHDLHQTAIAAKHDVEPQSRVELTAELGAGDFWLVMVGADGTARSTGFSVRS